MANLGNPAYDNNIVSPVTATDSDLDTPSTSSLHPPGEPLSVPLSSIPIEVEDEDSCTPENWKTFYSYRKQLGEGKALEPCDPKEFEPYRPRNVKALQLIKRPDNQIQLSIESTYLQQQLRKVIYIEHYHGVALSATNTLLESPFGPLYHHIEEMKSNVEGDSEATSINRAHMDALYYFATMGWSARLHEDVRSKISEGFIVYDDLWALFKPGDFAVCKDPLGLLDISKITSVKLEHNKSNPTLKRGTWYVTLVKITIKGGRFREASAQREIPVFADAKRITDLGFYPLSHHESKEELKEASIRRGRAWRNYCDGDSRVMTYQGEALPMVKKDLEYITPRYMSGLGSNGQSGANSLEASRKLTSTVILDPDAATKVIIQTNIDDKQRISHPSFHDGSIVHDHEISDFTEEGFMICPSSITVFNLDDHDWYSVNVDKLKEKEWRLEALDRLVLDQDRKDTLIRLASSNSRRVQAEKSRDVIEGKGKGIVFLLHGPPGVGKTLTAEVLSEYTKRPLLKVNLGRIASHEKWEQSLERIFSNAEDWKAILLIDEAEIVLEKRTFERMTQNSWISVFLRKLEYFQGILILTTNLIDCIDEAFESRISYPIRFYELGRDDRHQIWTSFIQNMNILPAYKTTLINEVDRWSEAEINGRQIRNIVLMAENLAASDDKHPRLMPHHIDELLNVTLEFCDYNHNNPARMKKIQLTGLSY